MFLEIELKLSIDPTHTALLFDHPLLMQSNPATEELISRYFDTADLSLWRQGLSLRTREAEGHTIQTLKTAGEQIGSLHHRHEWDQPIQGILPVIHGFEDQEVSKKLDSIIGQQPLIELFHTRFNRTQWNISASHLDFRQAQYCETSDTAAENPSTQHVNVRLASKRENRREFEANDWQAPGPVDVVAAEQCFTKKVNEDLSHAFNHEIKSTTPLESTQIELVLDQGVVSAGNHHMPLHEIELELKQGDANQLYKLAELLKQTIPLTLETRSKAQRGYLLYTDNNLSAPHA